MLSDDTAFLLVTGALRKGARARTPRDVVKASVWAANRQSSASAERQATALMVLRFLTIHSLVYCQKKVYKFTFRALGLPALELP
jgi:hypothetical protein